MIGESFAAVLASAQAGSEEAFSRLWRDVNPALLRYVRVLAPGAGEDIAAETWLRVVRGLGRFRGDEQDWRAWIFTICRHRAIDEGRCRSRRPAASLSELRDEALPSAPDAADLALQAISTRQALALVARLPAAQAEVIMLRVVAGLDTRAVAELVGRTQGAVRVIAHRGLRQLARILAEAEAAAAAGASAQATGERAGVTR